MAFNSYLTINGKIHGEVTGGVSTGYATDALGSVTATVDNAGSVANTYRYKPYGATLAKTGSNADPKSQWVGSWGYRFTGRSQSESYVRARHYGQKSGMWTTVDPLWPDAPALSYGDLNPIIMFDPTGMLSICNIRYVKVIVTCNQWIKGTNKYYKPPKKKTSFSRTDNCGSCKDMSLICVQQVTYKTITAGEINLDTITDDLKSHTSCKNNPISSLVTFAEDRLNSFVDKWVRTWINSRRKGTKGVYTECKGQIDIENKIFKCC